MLNIPINPLCCYIGRGCALCEWTAPDENVWYYEIYHSYNNYTFTILRTNIFNTRVMLIGLSVNKTLFLKIRSAYFIDETERYSDFCNIKKGTISLNPVTMRVTAVNGSTITQDAVFNFLDKKIGRIVSLKIDQEIGISN